MTSNSHVQIIELDSRRSIDARYTDLDQKIDSKWNPATRAAILKYVREGAYPTIAAVMAGVSATCFYRWKVRGSVDPEMPGHSPEHYDFFLQLAAAEGHVEHRCLQTIMAAADEDWKAADTLLQRRFKERWSPTTRNEVSGLNGGPVEFTLVLDTNARVPERLERGDDEDN